MLDNIMRPILIRRGVELPLLLIVAGVIGGLISFGVVGLFVGPGRARGHLHAGEGLGRARPIGRRADVSAGGRLGQPRWTSTWTWGGFNAIDTTVLTMLTTRPPKNAAPETGDVEAETE